VFLGVILGLQVGSFGVRAKILVEFKNLGVFVIFESVIFEGFCNSLCDPFSLMMFFL